MSLGRRVLPDGWLVLEGDSAVGPKADWRAYMDDFDEKHLDLKPGEEPTRFLVHQLSPAQKKNVDPLPRGFGRDWAVTRCGLRALKNYLIEKGGQQTCPEAVRFEDAGELGHVVAEDWMLSWSPHRSQLQTLAILIWRFSEPDLPLSKRSEPGSGPPDP